MPKINIVEPSVDIRAPQPGEVNVKNFTGGWDQAAQAAKTIDDTVQQFKKVRDYNQVSQAELGLRQELGQIEVAAANETDPTKIQHYHDKINEAIAKHSDGISDQMIKDEAISKFNITGYSTYASIANDFRKKTIDIGQANYLKSANQYGVEYSRANNNVDRKRIKDEWMNSLDSAQKAGLFSADDAEKMRIAQLKKFDENDLLYDVQNIPGEVANRRLTGAYANLTNKEIDDGIQSAKNMQERAEKERQEIIKRTQIKNEITVISNAANGMVYGFDEINSMVGNGEIRPEVGQAYVKYLSSPKVYPDARLDDTGYVKQVDDIFTAGNQDAMVRVITNTLDGGADGKMSQEQVRDLIALANKRANELYPTTDGVKTGSAQNDIDNAYKTVSNWAKTNKLNDEQKASVTSEWISALLKGSNNPWEAADMARSKYIQSTNPLSKQYKEKDVVTLPDGRLFEITGFTSTGSPKGKIISGK